MAMRRILVLILLALLAIPGAASARTNVAVGIGDQNASMFDAPAYRTLALRKTRYFIRWDAIRQPGVLAATDAFVAAARRAGVRVLLHISTNDLRHHRAKLPSVSAYRRDVGRLVRRYRAKGVKEWGVWNEANHKSQPTYRSPRRAAQYFKAMYRFCRGCRIVALDALDQAGVDRYIRSFYRALGRTYTRRAKVVGIHNYSDTNRNRSTGTRRIIRTVERYNRRTDFWLTETGGVVNFGTAFPCNEVRAAKRVSYMFDLARKYRRDVTRLYVYNWTGADCNGFDAGLTRADGSLRPGYATFKSRARSFTR
jgi:hypothetical protein